MLLGHHAQQSLLRICMPIANMLVDSSANNELLSFMDGFFGYN